MIRGLFLAARILTFATNPARTPTPELLEPASAPESTLTSPSLRALSCVDRGAVREVRACSLEPLAHADASDGDFTTPPHLTPDGEGDTPAEASGWFHAAAARAFFERLAGASLPNAVDIVAGLRIPASLRANDLVTAAKPETALDPYPLAFYLRAGEIPDFDRIYGTTRGTVWLGRGADRDLAYDGDVIAHEMTHAMLDGSLFAKGFRVGLRGASIEPEAMSEAIADYFAAAQTEDPVLDEWSAGEAGLESAYRDLTVPSACPSAIDGFSHDESALLSGALWTVRTSLGPALDAGIYRAITRLPPRPDIGYADLVDALDEDSKSLVQAELTRRNVGCEPIFTTLPLRSSGRGYAAPGTIATGTTPSPGILQLRVDVPAGTISLGVDFQVTNVDPGLFTPARSPFAPAVIVSWDAPLGWPNAAPIVNAIGTTIVHADIQVPANAKTAYVQIVNRGESDGIYDYITVVPAIATATSSDEAMTARGSGCAVAKRGDEDAPIATILLALLTAIGSRGGSSRRSSSSAKSSSSSHSSRR